MTEPMFRLTKHQPTGYVSDEPIGYSLADIEVY